MKRIIVLSVLVVASAVSLVVAAQQQATAPKVLEVTKLKDNLFVLKGGGGNTAVFIMGDGVTVVPRAMAEVFTSSGPLGT